MKHNVNNGKAYRQVAVQRGNLRFKFREVSMEYTAKSNSTHISSTFKRKQLAATELRLSAKNRTLDAMMSCSEAFTMPDHPPLGQS